jgi:hypothetical protein
VGLDTPAELLGLGVLPPPQAARVRARPAANAIALTRCIFIEGASLG